MSDHPLTPPIPFVKEGKQTGAEKEPCEEPRKKPRNTRPVKQLDMREEAVERRYRDTKYMNIGKRRVFPTEDFVDAVIENIANGASQREAILATAHAHPRVVYHWISQGQSEYDWRMNGRPCEDCSEEPGYPTGCEKCNHTGLIEYRGEPMDDLKVKLFLGLPVARAVYRNKLKKVVVDATKPREVTKKIYQVNKWGDKTLKSEVVSTVLPEWKAAVALETMIEEGRRVAAYNREVAGKKDKGRPPEVDEAGILKFNMLFGVEKNKEDQNVGNLLDITPYYSRLPDDLITYLAQEVSRCMAEDEAARESMKKNAEGDVFVIGED